MAWAVITLCMVVLVIGMQYVANCWGGVQKISLFILIEYAFMACTGTTLHRVVLVLEMHYVANCWGGV